MYRIYVRQPWDTTWMAYNPRKKYWTKFGANRQVKKLGSANWVSDRTELRVDSVDFTG